MTAERSVAGERAGERAASRRVFLSSAPADEPFRAELEAHLAPLRRSGAAVIWHDRSLLAGDDAPATIEAQLAAADVILLLVTPDLLAQEGLHGGEVQRALAWRSAGARVVPVLVRPCFWEVGELAGLAPLPKSGVFVESWEKRAEAWLDVVKGVHALLVELSVAREPAAARGAHAHGATTVPGLGAAPFAGAASAAAAGEGPSPHEERMRNEVRVLEERLTAAHARKQKLTRVSAPAAAFREVGEEILELRRKLRERGQLAAGDALSNERYVLVEVLGKGGFATVWRAHDEETREEVAIKVLHPQLVRDELRRERFFRGARVMAGLGHPGVVRVLSAEGHDRGFDYFVMELVRGGTLRDAVVGGRLSGDAIAEVLLQVGSALAAAHVAGHVHRDVKPANILLDEAGAPKLTDFDLVGGGQTTGGTRTGAMGTFVYAAPEAMVDASEADARADVFGLGMTGVFCYLGKELPPSVLRDAGRVIRKLPCPEGVKDALLRATEWEVEDRCPDVAAFCELLRAGLRSVVPVVPSMAEVRSPAPSSASDGDRHSVNVPSFPPPVPDENKPAAPPEPVWPGPSQRQPTRLEPGPQKPAQHRPWAVAQSEDAFGRFATFAVGEVTQRMRWIPPGAFIMGSPEGETGRDEEERQHHVTLSRGFWLAETPCTQALWEAVMGTNPSRFRSADRPVEQVSWDDCQDFLRRLNAVVPGLGARLPTEAEWEYACRAGTWTATWAGDLDLRGANNAPILDAIAWYGGNSGVGFELEEGYDSSGWPEKQHPHTRAGTRPVGRKRPNPWGLHDMLGNVFEWCEDRSGPYPVGPVVDPHGLATGSYRVIRGGSWSTLARSVRGAYRYARGPSFRRSVLGVRLARGQASAEEEGAEPREAGERSGRPGAAPAAPSAAKVRSQAPSSVSDGDRYSVNVPGFPPPVPDENKPAAPPEPVWPGPSQRQPTRLEPGPQKPAQHRPWAVAQSEDAFGRFATFAVGEVTQRMRWIPPGAFIMGSPEGETGRYEDERQHHVTLSRGFWLAETPCTQALWEAVMGTNPSRFRSADRPVERVSWDDCQDFLQRLNALVPGLGARLPTEAEWEYACRAGTWTATWAGDLDLRGANNAPILEAIAWYGGNSGVGFELGDGEDSSGWPEKQHLHTRAGTRPVGRKQPNPWGLHDMLGNVHEWCGDWYAPYPTGPVVDPPGSEAGSSRVFRGGSWLDGARYVRAADRRAVAPGERGGKLGFRLARDHDPEEGAEPRESEERSRRP